MINWDIHEPIRGKFPDHLGIFWSYDIEDGKISYEILDIIINGIFDKLDFIGYKL